jgi:tetratricopeptide (TPR) repeat protein
VSYHDDATPFGAQDNGFDRAIEYILIALLAFMPLALGAVEAWSELLVVIGASAAAVLLAVKLLIHRHSRFVVSWLYLPIALFVLVVVAQLMPLPAGVVAKLSPETLALRTRLLSDLPDAQRLLSAMTLSFYPPSTRQALRMLLAAGVILVVVANIFRSPDQIKRLLTAIAAIGAAAAALALAQDVTGAEGIYWSILLNQSKATGGPFVNYNNFAQFMNLSMGAMLALLLIRVDELGYRRHSAREVCARLSEPELRPVAVLIVSIVAASISIVLSGSRGGMIALVCAFGFAMLLTALKGGRNRRGWVMLGLGLIVAGGVIYTGFDFAAARLSTLQNLQQASGDRWQSNKDVLAMLPKFPLVGMGLETHQVVYPMFSNLNTSSVSANLENEFLQLAEETGAVGVFLLIVFIAMITTYLVKILRNGKLPVHAAAFGIAFALLAVLLHSLSDFGQRIPANACISAVLCGLLVSLVRLMKRRQPHVALSMPWRTVRAGMLIVVLAVSTWAAVGALHAADAERHFTRAESLAVQMEINGWRGTDGQFAQLISEAAVAADTVADNAQYRHWLNVYRWRAISRRDEQLGGVPVTAEMLAHTSRIVDELHAARALCPTFGETWSFAGQLELFVLNRPEGASHIRTGYSLAPTDPTTSFIAARLDASDGKWSDAQSKFRKSIALGRKREDAIDSYLAMNRPDMALSAVNDHSSGLLYLAEALDKAKTSPAVAQAARERVAELLSIEAHSADASPSALASMASTLAKQNNFPAAADFYRRALAKDYGNVGWRLGLAQALASGGDASQAMREARVCLRLHPEFADAQKLLGELSVRPDAGTRSR